MKYLAGLDIGTSGAKCIIIDQNGKVLSSVTKSYPVYTPRATWSEQEPHDWFVASCNGLLEAIIESGINSHDIISLGLSGQMHGLVPLGKDNHVLRRAILWNDQRTEKECEYIIKEAGGIEGLLSYTNNNMLPGYTAGKIVWLKNHEPEIYEKMHTFLLPKDYIRYKLTKNIATEVSDASGTGLFDVKKRKWAQSLINKLGLNGIRFPKVYESDEITGTITKEASAFTGLPEGLPVCGGGGDAVIQTTGMGIVEEGTVGLIIGTSGIVSMAMKNYSQNTDGALQYFCNNDKALWQAFGCQLSSGGALEWFKNALYGQADNVFKLIDEEAASSAPGANKLLFFPYLSGERCPCSDPNARGVFFGLSLLHGRKDMARAVMEGVTFGLRQIYKLIKKGSPSLQPKEIVSSGGASKSAVWRQIQADIINLPVKTLEGAAQGGAYGAALVAGVSSGIWSDIAEAVKVLSVKSVTYPIKENAEMYNKLFKVYDQMIAHFKQGYDWLNEL